MISPETDKQSEHQLAGQVSALYPDQQERRPDDVARLIVDFNRSSKAHENLWARTRQAADGAEGAEARVRAADDDLADADLAYQAAQAEHPDRTAPRLRQYLIAAGALALDGVACYFAAEALGGAQPESLAWAGLFLVLLGAGEIAMDYCRDGHRGLWRAIAAILAVFIILLGLLRFSFLAVAGQDGLIGALTGASLFTIATAGFVIIGYRVLRVAESGATWRARRAVRTAAAAATAERRALAEHVRRRDSLANAYLSRIRTYLIQACSASHLRLAEKAVHAHLIGGDPS